MARRPEDIATSVHQQLTELVRQLVADKPGGQLIEAELEALELPTGLRLGGDGDGQRFSSALVEHVETTIDAAIQRVTAVRPGRAFCHRCGGSDCDDATAPSSRHVFVGYAQTGQPVWQDFAQFCLDQQHPEVHQLYHERPGLLTVVQTGTELRQRLIGAFERRRYRLLGQVSAGFFALPDRELPGRPVLALTFQAGVSTSGRDRRRRFAMNVLGRGPDDRPLQEFWETEADIPWGRAVRWAQSALETIPRKGARSGLDSAEERVLGILNGLARRLRQDGRARSRRTRHAEERHASGERPTRKAVDDARRARVENCLCDARTGALVILGDRGRTHFFSPDGRLVSSVRYSRDAISRKRRSEQWTPASADALDTLRRRLPD